MIHLVALAVVCFLKTDHAVESRVGEPPVIFGAKGHHLYGKVAEIRAAYLQRLLEIVGSGKTGILAGNNQQILERPERLYGLAFLLDFLGRENHAVELVVAVEAAVNAGVRAGIGDVERDENRDGLSEALLGDFAAPARHLLEIWSCRGRNERHEVAVVEALFCESALHVGRCHGHDFGRCCVPVVFL